MARSKWKLKYFSNFIWKKIFFLKLTTFFKTRKIFYDRASVIPECFALQSLRIHKGKYTRKLLVHIYNIGFKFGEFSYSRKPFHFPLKKSKKRKQLIYRR